MISLQDSEELKGRLKTCKKIQIEALHKFIFEENGDRNNRQRLREFTGFEYDEKNVKYREKSAYIDANLSNADLTSCCIILGLDYNAENLKMLIFKNLCKDNLLKEMMKDDDEEDGEEEIENDAQANTRIGNETVYDDACTAVNSMSIQEDDDVVSVSSKGSNAVSAHSRRNAYAPCFTLNFRDIEESIRPFDGSGKIPIETWIADFQEISQLMQWNDFQTLIHAKKSLIEHTMKEFKQKICTYEVFIKHQKVQSTGAVKKYYNERPQYKKVVTETQEHPKSRCYKSGDFGHISANCTTGLKCFRCNKQGHIAKDCQSKKAEEKLNNMNLVVKKKDIVQLEKKDIMMKDVRILDQKNSALFDTGSSLNLMRLLFYKKLGEPEMHR